MGNADYQRGFIAHIKGFKVATSTYVLSLLDRFKGERSHLFNRTLFIRTFD